MTIESEVCPVLSLFLHAKEAEKAKMKRGGRRFYLRQERLRGEIA